jgi:hypothetical protein
MQQISKVLLAMVVAIGILSGCTSIKQSRYTIHSGSIINASGETIHNVVARHQPTLATAMTNSILANRTMKIGLPDRVLQADSVTISWSDHQYKSHQQTLQIPRPSKHDVQSKEIVYTIDHNNRVWLEIK